MCFLKLKTVLFYRVFIFLLSKEYLRFAYQYYTFIEDILNTDIVVS
jgi:hypothetical protein